MIHYISGYGFEVEIEGVFETGFETGWGFEVSSEFFFFDAEGVVTGYLYGDGEIALCVGDDGLACFDDGYCGSGNGGFGFEMGDLSLDGDCLCAGMTLAEINDDAGIEIISNKIRMPGLENENGLVHPVKNGIGLTEEVF